MFFVCEKGSGKALIRICTAQTSLNGHYENSTPQLLVRCSIFGKPCGGIASDYSRTPEQTRLTYIRARVAHLEGKTRQRTIEPVVLSLICICCVMLRSEKRALSMDATSCMINKSPQQVWISPSS